MAMFGARSARPALADFSWLLPAAIRPTTLSTDLSWLFPDGVPRTDNGPDPFGYNPPFVPPETLPTEGQRCRAALQVSRKSTDDVARVQGLMPVLRAGAAPYGIDPNMLAALALRETGGRNIAEIGKGGGMGVFQLTNQPISAAEAYNIPFAAGYAANMLSRNGGTLANRHPSFTKDQLLQATFASYNKYFGHGRSLITDNPATIDAGTKGENYGRNVLDLMSCFPPIGTR